MNATLEVYRKRLQSLPKEVVSPSRAGSIAATRRILNSMREEIRGLLQGGNSATAIARALAPRGERPSWETVRRAIAEEFDLPRKSRQKHGARKASAQRAGKSERNAHSKDRDTRDDVQSRFEAGAPSVQAGSAEASSAIARVNSGKKLFQKVVQP